MFGGWMNVTAAGSGNDRRAKIVGHSRACV